MKHKNMDWREKKVTIIGDVMIDQYITGVVRRISPEAPVPIFEEKNERFVAGGAGNVAANVASLKGMARLYGVRGEDTYGYELERILKDQGVTTRVAIDVSRPTTRKTRYIAGHHQQLMRSDHESRLPIAQAIREKLYDDLTCHSCDAIICSDYAKGVISQELVTRLIKFGHRAEIPIIIDPKPSSKIDYRGAYLITPNRTEASELAGFALDTKENIARAGKSLVNRLESNVLITLGEEGMALFQRNGDEYAIPAQTHEVADVSGAGDTVVAVMALALASNYSLQKAMQVANRAAGIKVTKSGTQSVTYTELFH
jgi:D-beta-D-heptose 7-phosphate kinase/D-beta-D-heptose 1-phosphate adenosyltransferase